MQVHSDIENLPEFRKAVITIGTFDGVHLGHKKILDQICDDAKKLDGESVIITFHPHPRSVVRPDEGEIRLLTTIPERIELLRNLGIDHLVIVPFTNSFSNLSAPEYIEKFLIGKFRPRLLVTGYDHRFGKNRSGDYKLLESYAAKGSFELREIPAHVINDNAVSSTTIRKAIVKGDIDSANALLGYTFFFDGTVISGNKLGRTLGYPTANLRIEEPEKIIPAYGVYAVEAAFPKFVAFDGKPSLKGMMNIGIRPTLDDRKFMIEINLFDFSRDIYGETLRVYVRKWLRPEAKFQNLGELVEQMDKDREDSLKLL
jgi:riboflavin kinase / FMN adenylyltransferase